MGRKHEENFLTKSKVTQEVEENGSQTVWVLLHDHSGAFGHLQGAREKGEKSTDNQSRF